MSAPNLVDILVNAMMTSDDIDMGVSGDPEYYERQARAVLTALTDAGRNEWMIFRASEGPDAQAFDTFVHSTKVQAQSRIKRMYPAMVDELEPRSRVTGPWERDS